MWLFKTNTLQLFRGGEMSIIIIIIIIANFLLSVTVKEF